MPRFNSPAELDRYRRDIQANRNKPCVAVCSGTACHGYASDKVSHAFAKELEAKGLQDKVDVRRTGCQGLCEMGPLVVVCPEETCYLRVKPEDVAEIVNTALIEKKPVGRLLYVNDDGQKVKCEGDIPFFKNQNRVLFADTLRIDPSKIDDYIAAGGYSALAKALFELSPDKVLDEMIRSNLRGRGGAGFPAGIKWEATRKATGDVKYVVANGAYSNRSLLEGNPHSVIEGLIIGAYAIGAHEGFVYTRQEYPLVVKNLRTALEQAKEYGLLGANILGSNFSFNIRLHLSAGGFLAGESSAVITAIEGGAGEPRAKYVPAAVSGINGHPTDLNNVETWANVPHIINRGANWFRSLGTEGSRGTKIFTLGGKVKNTGTVEVPMGTTLRKLIYDIGGGIRDGKKLKAVQVGGPSGGIIPAASLDLPVDFDQLAKAGSIMGSSDIIAMDEDSCMVDTARYFLNFLKEESCGKCIPCREGLYQMQRILDRICEGKGVEGDIESLEEIGAVVRDFSLCGLGQTTPNPVLTTIKYFRDEYEAHIKEQRCPTMVCKALISYYIEPTKCRACGICLKNCPAESISGDRGQVHIIDQRKCTQCGTCFTVCPKRFSAVSRLPGKKTPEPVAVGTEAKR